MKNKIITKAFSSNIESGKNTYVYDAHTYHTKVPPEGIKEVIKYYTEPGDVILDPFCGSGMTGVAASEIMRKAKLSDLSPAAVFIAKNLTSPIDSEKYINEIIRIKEHFKEEEKKLYQTSCRTCDTKTIISYTVWSYDVVCSCCSHEFSLFDAAKLEKENYKESKILSEFPCPQCGIIQKKRSLKKTSQKPILIGYKCSNKTCGKGNKDNVVPLNEEDLKNIEEIEKDGVPNGIWYPTDKFPIGMNTAQPIRAGITSIDKAYTPRALRAMAQLWDYASNIEDDEIKEKVLFTITSLYQRVTVFSEFRFWGGSGNIANYSVPSVMNEQNVFTTFLRKAKTIAAYFKIAPKLERDVTACVKSATDLNNIEDNSIDYIFTDPPFGSNINYSEMNFLWESWLKDKTMDKDEAIMSKVQNKGLEDYKNLLTKAFSECKRVLKPNSWITVVFHNSSDKVWGALQDALNDAGLKISDAQTFDKKHGTFKQYVSQNAVGYDIMVHCQKNAEPNNSVNNFGRIQTEEQIMDFITTEINAIDSNYEVKYLHVERSNEFDYRKLYAKWLTSSISNSYIKLSFDDFRIIANKVIPTIQD